MGRTAGRHQTGGIRLTADHRGADAFIGVNGPIGIEINYDEFVIGVSVTYDGIPLDFPSERPDVEGFSESEDAFDKLAGFLIRSHADRVRASTRNGQAVLRRYFDH